MEKIINHLKQLDGALLGAIVLIFLMGLLTFYGNSGDHALFWRQLTFGLIGLAIIIGLSFFDWRIIRDNSWLVFFFYAVAAALLFILFGVGERVRGVVSWFKFGAFNFEPVEIAKVILVLVLAKYFSSRFLESRRWGNIIVSGLYAGVLVIMVLLQPDLGSAVILMAVWLGLVLVSGIKVRQFLLIMILAAVAGTFLWNYGLKDYQKDRVVSFLYPERDPLGGAYQGQQAIIAVGSGGWWGKGLGQGTQTRLGFLPEYQTDFIFAAIAEEWGWIGVLILLAGWLVIFFRLSQGALGAPDNFSRLFISGIIIILGAHFLINVGANLGLMPITGIPLVFVSYGGSNLVSMCVAIGLIQSIRIRSLSRGAELKVVEWE